MTAISNTEQLRRQTLDLLRFPLAIVVMLIHIWPGPDSIEPQYPILKLICSIISSFLSGQSVPIYFFIAGYVFFYNVEFNRETYIKKLKNRTKTLLIPYLVWNTITLLILIIVTIIGDTPIGQQVLHPNHTGINLSLKNIFDCYWVFHGYIIGNPATDNITTPIDGPLWFVRNLILIVLFTPVLYKLIKYLKHYFVIALCIIWFVVCPYYIKNSFINQMISSVLFFSYGAYMSIHKRDMLIEFGRYFKCSMLIYPALGLLYVIAIYVYPDACPIIKRLNIFAGLLFAYNLSSWLLHKGYCKVIPILASSAFFIYVSHVLIIGRFSTLLNILVHTHSDIQKICYFSILSVMTIGVLLGVFYLLHRYTPNFLKIIIGRR